MKCFRLFGLFFCGIVVASGFAESRHPLRTRKEEFPISSNKPLEVLVEVSVGEVIIEKSPIEKTLTVWVGYNEDVCELDLEFLPKQNQFYLELANVDKFWKDKCKDSIQVKIGLPRDVELSLEGKLKVGNSRLDLGGLRLKEVKFSQWVGELDMEFATPNQMVMERLEIKNKVGSLSLHHLGNARSRKSWIKNGIGQCDLDFRGQMEPESRVKIDSQLGQVSVLVPDSIGVRVKFLGWSPMTHKEMGSGFHRKGSSYYSEDYETQPYHSFFLISSTLGEVLLKRE